MATAGALLCPLQWVDDDVVIPLKRCCYVSLCTDFQLGGKINTKMMNLLSKWQSLGALKHRNELDLKISFHY